MLFEGGAADRSTVEPYAQSDRPWPTHDHGDAPTPPPETAAHVPAAAAPSVAPPPAPLAPVQAHAPSQPAFLPPGTPLPAAPADAAPPPTAPSLPQAPLAVAPAPSPAFPTAVPEPPAPPVHRVVLRLAGGEQVEVATHEDEAAARAEATALMRYLRDGGGDWPFVAGRFLRPEAIVSVDVAGP